MLDVSDDGPDVGFHPFAAYRRTPIDATLACMTRDADGATSPTDDVRAASDRWWDAYQGGAPAEVVQALWSELSHLCRIGPAPAPMDDQASRFV